jgi:hypothetical protein
VFLIGNVVGYRTTMAEISAKVTSEVISNVTTKGIVMNRSSLCTALILGFSLVVLGACSDDAAFGSPATAGAAGASGTSGTKGGGTSGTKGTGGNGSGGNGTAGNGAGGSSTNPMMPSPMMAGWESAFQEKSAGINCNMSLAEMTGAGAATLKVGEVSLVVGFEQDGQNQNPVFARFDGDTPKYCEHHEKEGPDGRAYGVTWNGGKIAYVVYTIVGGGSAFDQKGNGSWLSSYGNGGGSSKVTYLGEVETDFGDLVRGTFSIAKKMDGKTNSHTPLSAPIVRQDGGIEILGSSAFQPMNPDKTIMDCTGYPFYTRYVFSMDFKSLLCSSSTNCTAKQDCNLAKANENYSAHVEHLWKF